MKGGKIVGSGLLRRAHTIFTLDSIKPKAKIDEGDTIAGANYVLGDLAKKR